jgi:hypothetical protein
MGTEGSHATAHHSPLAAGIVVGDFKSKARDEIPQESKRRESVRPASSELIFQRRSFQEIDVTPACGLQYETPISLVAAANLGRVDVENADHPSLSRAES